MPNGGWLFDLGPEDPPHANGRPQPPPARAPDPPAAARPEAVSVDLIHGDCLDVLPTLPAASVDCVVTDPPYPEIDRPYGRMTEAEWHAMMRRVVAECRRVLKPRGSAVFILQPNSERVGRMRPWLWEFLAWTAREWNQVQDAWWWNLTALPLAGAQEVHGLMRSSVKACVWLGPEDCRRYQGDVLWTESDGNRVGRTTRRFHDVRESRGSIGSINRHTSSVRAGDRGGTTPYNLLPVAGVGAPGHSAGTPPCVASWWVRYLSRPGDVVLDPFCGSGTVPAEAVRLGRHAVGVERVPEYYNLSVRNLAAVRDGTPLFDRE